MYNDWHNKFYTSVIIHRKYEPSPIFHMSHGEKVDPEEEKSNIFTGTHHNTWLAALFTFSTIRELCSYFRKCSLYTLPFYASLPFNVLKNA